MTLALLRCGSDGTFQARFVAACGTSSNLPTAVCECLADRAVDQLSAEVREFLIVSMEGDDDAIAEKRGELGVTEALEAGLFMTEASTCREPVG